MKEQIAAPAAENIYQKLVDNLPDLVFVLNSEGEYISVHGEVRGVLGYTKDELCGMNFLQISDPGGTVIPISARQHPFLQQFAEPTCGSKTVSEFHMTARSKSGEIRYLELNGTGIYDQDGNLTFVYVVARDITLRRRLQARVDYLRQLNEKILNTLHEGMIVLSVPDLRILNVNRSFLAAVKLQENQLVGFTGADIYSRHGRPTLFADMPALLQRTVSTGRASRREYLAADLMSSPVHLELFMQPIEQTEKNTRQILVLLRDITRRKHFETDMKRRVQKLSSLNIVSETLQGTIQQLDEVLHCVLVGVTAGKGLGFNRAFILLADESTGMLEGRMALGPSDPQEAGQIWTNLDRSHLAFSGLLRSRESLPNEHKINRISQTLKIPLQASDHLLIRSLLERRVFNVTGGKVRGEEGIVVNPDLLMILETDSFVVVPLYTTQRPIGVLIADNFITRRPVHFEDLEFLKILSHHASSAIDNARLYQELEQKVKDVESANRSLQEKQMALIEAERLSTIGKMAASVAHEIRNPLVTIGGYARLLLKDLPAEDPRWEDLNVIGTEVSRLEFIVNEVLGYARYAQPQLAPGDLNKMIERTLQTFNNDWTFDNVRVDLELDENLPTVRMDENQMKQVLINILLNAHQSMPDGGRVLITTRSTDKWVELVVADTGCGIPEHLWDKVFTPFFTTKSSGTGLGLNIATQIIAAHGGHIHFESAEGKGTTFWITLPKVEVEKDRQL